MNEKKESSNYSLNDFKRFLNGMQEVVGQAEREHEDLVEALRENRSLREQITEYKAELTKTMSNHKEEKDRLLQLEGENSKLRRTVEQLKQIHIEINTINKMKKDGDAVLDILLQAYKELDIESMTKFEVAFSQLNDDADHRYQKQLDCFRKVRREKAKEKKQASVMNIDNRGGYAFLDSELKDTKFY